MSLFDLVKEKLKGKAVSFSFAPKSCKDEQCYYYETKDGYYGYCKKMGKNLVINLAQTCPLRLVTMATPQASPRELKAEKKVSVMGEDNVAVATPSTTWTLKKIVVMTLVTEGKRGVDTVFADLKATSPATAYIKLTVESPTISETTEIEQSTTSTEYVLFYQKLSQEYYGDYIKVRVYLKSSDGTKAADNKTQINMGWEKTEFEYE